jgi:signal transduction histidine kinase
MPTHNPKLERRLIIWLSGVFAVSILVFVATLGATAYRQAGEFGLIARGGPVDAKSWLWEEITGEVLPTLVPLLIVTLTVVVVTVRVTLRPLRQLSAQANEIQPETSETRLDLEGVPAEIVPVIGSVNRAFDRIAEGLRLQRRFTANAAHELRTPLAVLRARVDSMPPSAAVLALRGDVDRMARVVDDLLAVARLEAREADMHTHVDLARVARNVLALLAPLAHAEDKDVALTAPDEPVWIKGNASVLERTLRNLVENCLRHTSPGTCVDVAVRHGAKVTVRDRGPGVPATSRQRIFEPFWRGEETRAGGAGLGLAIAAEAVELHGGRIAVDDAPGGGAVFAVELPELAA